MSVNPHNTDIVLHSYTVFRKTYRFNGYNHKTMTERYSIAEARRNLPKLVHEAERGKAVELTRRGEPVAMLVSHRRFKQLTSNYSGFAEAYRTFAASVDLVKLDLNPDQLFSGIGADIGTRSNKRGCRPPVRHHLSSSEKSRRLRQ